MTDEQPRRGGGRDLALAMLAAFCFGTTIVFQRAIAKDGTSSASALSIRFGISSVLLLVSLRVSGRPLLPPPGERGRAFFLGIGLYTFESTCFYLALERGTAAAVALLFYSYPAVVSVIDIALGALRPNRATVASLALSVAGGVTVAVGGGHVAITAGGIGFVLGSVALFSTYVVAGHRIIPRTDALTAAAWTAIGAAVGVATLGVAQGSLHAPTARAFGAIAATGTATAIAFTLFFVVLARLGPSRTAIVMALEAVFGVVLSAVFLGEEVRALVVVGGVAILSGTVIAALSRAPDQEAAASP